MASRNALIATLAVALALAGHWAALRWLAEHAVAPPRLHQMAEPMLTRTIVPEAPRVVAAVRAPAPPPPSRLSAVTPTTLPAATPTTPSTAASSPVTAATAVRAGTPPAASATPTIVAPEPPAPVEVAAAPIPAQATEPALSATLPAPVPAVAAASAVQPPPDALAGWPTDTRLSYQLSGWFRGELYGDARVQWQRDASRYQVRIDIDVGPFVSLRMTSQGTVTPQGLRPGAYEEVRRNKVRGLRLSESELLMDGGGTLPRPAGVQDTASQFVELAHRFGSGKQALVVGSTVSFWMARPGGVDFWTYDIAERVTLKTPGFGPVEAFHLKPRPLANPRGNITAEMWFAPSLQYLPVRIRINQGQDIWLDLLVEKIEQR